MPTRGKSHLKSIADVLFHRELAAPRVPSRCVLTCLAKAPGNHNYMLTYITDLQRTMAEHIPLHRFGTVDEVADAAVFLAQNEYANNCVLNLDGGLSAV